MIQVVGVENRLPPGVGKTKSDEMSLTVQEDVSIRLSSPAELDVALWTGRRAQALLALRGRMFAAHVVVSHDDVSVRVVVILPN